MTTLTPASYGSQAGGKRHGVSVKKLKRVLKKAGLKTTGKKSTLTRRVKKAHLKLKGGADADPEVKEEVADVAEEVKEESSGGRRRRSRRGSRRH